MTILVLLPPQYWCYHVTGHEERNLRRFLQGVSHPAAIFHRDLPRLLICIEMPRPKPASCKASERERQTQKFCMGSLPQPFTAPNWQFYFDTAHNSLAAWKSWIIAQGAGDLERWEGRNLGDWIKLQWDMKLCRCDKKWLQSLELKKSQFRAKILSL